MSETNLALTGLNADVPAFLQTGTEEADNSLLKQYVIVPRMMVVMGTSDAKFTDVFGLGDVILPDTMTLIAEKGRPFTFTPVFFYPQFELRNPRDASDLPSLREVSLDPKSELAKKARERVEEVCPDGGIDKEGKPRLMRYQESLNAIIWLHELQQLVFVSFYRAEQVTGKRLASLIVQRKVAGKPAPMYGCIFQASTSIRVQKGNKWPGFDITNPTASSAWVQDEDLFNQLKQIATEERDKYVTIREQLEEVDTHDTHTGSDVDAASEFA